MPILPRVLEYCRAHSGEIWRFAIVGIVTFAINFLSFSFFFGVLHADYRIAVSIAYGITVACHFALNKRFTVAAGSQNLGRNAPRYGLMLGLNYVIAIFASWLTVEVVGVSPYYGIIASVAGTSLSSFFVMRYFVFNAPAAT